MTPIDPQKIQEITQEFFEKATLSIAAVKAVVDSSSSEAFVVAVEITMEDPKIIIGQGGQTLFDLQRLLKIVLNRRLGSPFYINLDVNGYKQKKMEYLAQLARDLADQVTLSKTEKALSPMPAYERRVLHQELAKQPGIISESRGDGADRHIVIKVK